MTGAYRDVPISGRRQRAGAVEVGGGVDAEGDRVDDRRVDAHAGFERAELLELLALFQRRGRQRDVALERGAAVGVEPDVVIERPRAPRRGGAGEIEDAEDAGVFFGEVRRRTDHLDDVRVGAFFGARDDGADGADIARRFGERRQRGAHASPPRRSAGRPEG